MRLRRLALLAFLAMCLQDILATSMVVFEAHYRAVLAGVFDDLYWTTGLISTSLAIGAILKNGWRSRRALTIIAAVSVGNFVGTIIGVYMAKAM